MRRVQVTFWALVVVAVLATGGLSTALSAEPSATAGLAVAASGVVLTATIVLAVRILLAVGRQVDED